MSGHVLAGRCQARTGPGGGRRLAACGLAWLGVVLPGGGCTAESTRVAIETQRRADQVQQEVFLRQHEALTLLLYRDLLRRLSEAGPLNDAQRAAAAGVWNDRDLVEFWQVQNERARAVRLLGVDAKLYADQSIADLLWKQIEVRLERARQGAASAAGEQVAERFGGSGSAGPQQVSGPGGPPR